MSRKTVLVVVAAVAVLSIGFVGIAYPGGTGFGQPDQQGATPINWEVAGTIAIVQLPLTAAGTVPGFLIDALVKGAPGRVQFRVLSVGAGAPAIRQ